MWKELLTSLKPQRILEIGSYEGASACGAIRILSAQEKLEIIVWIPGAAVKIR